MNSGYDEEDTREPHNKTWERMNAQSDLFVALEQALLHVPEGEEALKLRRVLQKYRPPYVITSWKDL